MKDRVVTRRQALLILTGLGGTAAANYFGLAAHAQEPTPTNPPSLTPAPTSPETGEGGTSNYFDLANYEYQPGDEYKFTTQPKASGNGYDLYGPDGKKVFIENTAALASVGFKFGEIQTLGDEREGFENYRIAGIPLKSQETCDASVPHYADPNRHFNVTGTEFKMLFVSKMGAPVIVSTCIPSEVLSESGEVVLGDRMISYTNSYTKTSQSWEYKTTAEVYRQVQDSVARQEAVVFGFLNPESDETFRVKYRERYGEPCDNLPICQYSISASSNHSGLSSSEDLVEVLKTATTPIQIELEEPLGLISVAKKS